MELPPCPPSLRAAAHLLKTASEHEGRDVTVVYWCRVRALQLGLQLCPDKGPEETKLLLALMDWLEKEKKTQHDNETITNEVAAQAHLENYALKLFLYADKQDREGNYGKNVVKAFYTSGIIYDVLVTFGELTEECTQNRKYAKWKAAYIHNCLKNGETPVPGPLQSEEENQDEAAGTQPPNEPSSSDAIFNFPQPPSGQDDSNNFESGGSSAHPIIPPINVLPSVPHTPDQYPGGFHPFVPPPTMATVDISKAGSVTLTAEQMAKAQKYCKWAGSALNYDDVATALTNLTNAIQLLQTGHDPA